MRTVLKKITVLAIAIAITLPAWTAGQPEGTAPKPAPVVKVMIGDNYAAQRTASGCNEQDNPYSQFILAKTGVQIILDRQTGEGAYNEKVTLTLASGNAADMVWMGGNDQFCMNIARSGALELLNPYLGKYANLTRVYNDDYWKEFSFEGKKLVLKGVQIAPLAGRAILIRQDWLTSLNLKMPQTIEELRLTAKKFVEAKLDGKPVVGTTGRKNFSYFYALSSAFGSPSPDVQMGYYYIDKAKKKLVFWNTTDAARAYFREALRWTKEGLLDPELLSTSGAAFWDKVNGGNVGLFCHRAESVGWLTTSIRQAQKRAEPTLAVVPALGGTGYKNPFGKEGGFEEDYAFEGYYGIPKGTKNIDNVLKVLDFECSREFADYAVLGLEGIEHKIVNGRRVLDKANADKVSFAKDYWFTCDRNALSADASEAFVVDASGGGDAANNFLYDTAESALARTKTGYAAAAAQAVPHQIFAATIPALPVQAQYPDVLGSYLGLYVKLITGEWDAGNDADWQAYLKAVEATGIPAITKAKEDYLLANSPDLFR